MSAKTKSLLYNFACFAILYIFFYFLAVTFTQLSGLWVPLTAAVVASLLAPKFQAMKVQDKERIFVKWIFIKGIKEVK